MPRDPKNKPLPALTLNADDVVAEILGDADRRQDELKLSPEERKRVIETRRKTQAKQEAARNKAEKQKPNRLHLLLSQDLKGQITEIAELLRIPMSQVVTFLLYEAFERYTRGEIDFDPFLTSSKSPRYDFNLIHPKDAEREEKFSTKKRKTAN